MKLWEACELALKRLGRPATITEIAEVIEDMGWFEIQSLDSLRCQIRRRSIDYNGEDKAKPVFAKVGQNYVLIREEASHDRISDKLERYEQALKAITICRGDWAADIAKRALEAN